MIMDGVWLLCEKKNKHHESKSEKNIRYSFNASTRQSEWLKKKSVNIGDIIATTKI